MRTRKEIVKGLIFSFTFFIVFYIMTRPSYLKSWPAYFKQIENAASRQTTTTPVSILCDRKTTIFTRPCLCYVDAVEGSSGDIILSTEDSRVVSNLSLTKCAMTCGEIGRMGNVMGQYATLLALSRMNDRPALMTPGMATFLRRYFKVTMPSMSGELYSSIQWTGKGVNDWMEESYSHFEGLFIKVTGYPNSYTFYDHLQVEIKKEFTLQDEIQEKAQDFLRQLIGNRTPVTFVGVHVRRGDYVRLMNATYKGVLAERDFFVQATGYFRFRYPDAIFVVVSNGMEWCKENIPNDLNDVYFVGNSDESDPISDFAILVNCNHTIFTIGSYGYWAAYLTGGEAIYLANFTLPDSSWHSVIHDEATYLPRWIPISADLSPLTNLTTSTTLQTTLPTTQSTFPTTQTTSPTTETASTTTQTTLPTTQTTSTTTQTTSPTTETASTTTQTTLPTTQTTSTTTQTTLPTTQTTSTTTQTTLPTIQTTLPTTQTASTTTQTASTTTQTTLPTTQTASTTTQTTLSTTQTSTTTQTTPPTTQDILTHS